VFKIGEPRTDVKIQVDQWSMPPFMGLGSLAAFTPGHGGAMMMGDTVLFEDEVNPVMSAAFDAGLEVTALHNHFFFDEPKVYFMHTIVAIHQHMSHESPRYLFLHYWGKGKALDLARSLKRVLDAQATVKS
jgi:Domain of Unknown Function (DUF1259)